ncbi:hypothetical protein KO495_07570 [Colwellia sp. D2M02]|uniref:hypothetical protein n=1 Tax=Colwellia sp. D2M02 TaxID=2841562 RepID=UPI001C094A21|nr:hypothetical protein [Colwellia sp. D2M02]MBU2893185.1 hypothetical protein [Colwellia sp. D2M02]
MRNIMLYTVATIILLIVSMPLFASDTLLESLYKGGSNPHAYTSGIDKSVTFNDNASRYIKSKKDSLDESDYVALLSSASVNNFKGKRLKLTVNIKTSSTDGEVGAFLGIYKKDRLQKPKSTGYFNKNRKDRRFSKNTLAFDNMHGREVTGSTEWQEYAIVLDVPQNADNMIFGVLLVGSGQVWFNDLAFYIVDKNTPVTDLFDNRTENNL